MPCRLPSVVFSFERGGEVCEDRRQCGGLGERLHVPGIDAGGDGCAEAGRHGVEKRRRELLVVIGPDVEGRHGEGQGHARAVEVDGFCFGGEARQDLAASVRAETSAQTFLDGGRR